VVGVDPRAAQPKRRRHKEDAEVFQMLERVEVLDVTLPNSDSGAIEDLAGAIQSLRALRICKGTGTYPNQPAPRALPDALTDAFTACPELMRLPLPLYR
jgi:hypothetical protein